MRVKNIEFAGPDNRLQSRAIADLFRDRDANVDAIRGITRSQELKLLDNAYTWHQYIDPTDEDRGAFMRNRIPQLS